MFKDRGELVVLYFNFVRYSKVEEIYGWEKLDAVLETTASAVKSSRERSASNHKGPRCGCTSGTTHRARSTRVPG